MNEEVQLCVRSFRVKELHEVLLELGLSRSGRKSELVERLNAYASTVSRGDSR
jgi:hypothetical protein